MTKTQAKALRATKTITLIGLLFALLGAALAQAPWLQGDDVIRRYAPMLGALCMAAWGASGWLDIRCEIRRTK